MPSMKNTIEQEIEDDLINKLEGLNYVSRKHIRKPEALEANF